MHILHYLIRSTLSVIGTWYVTIIIIVKYFWPDKEVSPGIIPVRSELQYRPLESEVS